MYGKLRYLLSQPKTNNDNNYNQYSEFFILPHGNQVKFINSNSDRLVVGEGGRGWWGGGVAG